MLKLSLEAIEIVDAIARHGSFAAASERLHKVPSTISYAVAKLEGQLGLALFVRNGPRVALTPAGQELLKEGRWLLAAARQLESHVRKIATGFEAELRLVHDSLIPTSAFNPDICAFEDLNCGTRLRIGTETLTGTWEMLREGRADLIVAAGEGPVGGGYQAVAVGSLDFAFCVTPTHPLVPIGRTLTRDDLLEHTAIVVGEHAVQDRMSDRRTGARLPAPGLCACGTGAGRARGVAGRGAAPARDLLAGLAH
jgi:DNA-binding transcriptional LysR family regulator